MSQSFEQWCIVEVMGHQKFAGLVTEQVLGGASFIRIDIPAVGNQPEFTKMFGASSIYAITPCTEEVARGVAATLQNRPVSVYDLPEDWKEKLRRPALEHVPSHMQDDNGYDD